MTDTSTAKKGELVLRLRGISKHFRAVSALTDIDWMFMPAKWWLWSATTARANRRSSRFLSEFTRPVRARSGFAART